MTVEQVVMAMDGPVEIRDRNGDCIDFFYQRYGYRNSFLECNDLLKSARAEKIFCLDSILRVVCDYKK